MRLCVWCRFRMLTCWMAKTYMLRAGNGEAGSPILQHRTPSGDPHLQEHAACLPRIRGCVPLRGEVLSEMPRGLPCPIIRIRLAGRGKTGSDVNYWSPSLLEPWTQQPTPSQGQAKMLTIHVTMAKRISIQYSVGPINWQGVTLGFSAAPSLSCSTSVPDPEEIFRVYVS